MKNQDRRIKIFLKLNYLTCFVLFGTLIFYLLKIPFFRREDFLIIISAVATLTVFLAAIRSLKEKVISIDFLASIALFISLLKKEWLSAIFINLMIASARTFINYVKIRSHSALNSLLKLKPQKVKVIGDGRIKEIPIGHVKKGDRVIIELGEKIPVDGFIENGEATIDQSSLTGESMPVFKKKGDSVLSFTTVVSGNLIIRAEKVGAETTFEKIIDLVEKSEYNKAPIYTLINKFADWYIIGTIFGSFIVYLLSRDVNLVLALLLVSCADDIAVATPLALMSAITHSAKHGVIVKGGDYLETLSKVKVMVFDKTGTLTKGKLKVRGVLSFNDKNEEEVLGMAAAASYFSSHPVAKTIINYAKNEKIPIKEPEKFEEYGGKGMTAVYKDKKIISGKPSFLLEMGIKITDEQANKINEETSKGHNVVLVGYDSNLIGFIILEDELRPKVKETIKKLKEVGIEKIVMLTGDNEKVAKDISGILGINEFHANLLPEDKINCLKKYLNKKYKVAMVGDGVNDAPVLAISDVGIAMGAIGSDAAIEAADIAIMKDDLSQLPEIIKVSYATVGVIRQNLFMWGVLNVIGFTLVFLHVLNPAGAAVYNFLSDFIPIINSLRLFI